MPRTQRSSSAVFRALHELAVVTTARTTPDEVARVATRLATRLLGDSATLRWWDPDREELVILHDTSVDGATPARPPAGGAAGRAFATGRPVLIGDTMAGRESALYPGSPARSVAAVPLLVGDRRLGTLAVRSDEIEAYGAQDIRVLELMAAQVAPALLAALDAAEREQANQTMTFLHELAVASGGILDPLELAGLAARRAAELLHADAGAVAWADGAEDVFRSIDTEFGVLPAKPGQGILWQAYHSVHPVDAMNYVAEIGPVTVPGLEIRSAVAVPLVVADRPIGALGVRSRSERRFRPRDVATLRLLAAQVGPALEGARVHRELERRTAAMLALDEIASAVGNVLDEGRIVAVAAERVKSLLAVDSVTVSWLDAGHGGLRSVDSSHALDDIAQVAFETELPVVVDTAAVVPLRVGERVMGALGVQSARPRTFAPDDLQALSLVAAQLAPAIHAARLHSDLELAIERAERHARQQQEAATLGRLALAGADEETVILAAVQALREAVDADFVGICQVDADRRAFVLRHLSGPKGNLRLTQRRKSFADWGMSQRAFREGTAMVGDLPESAEFTASPLLSLGARSAMAVRIGAHVESAFGVLGVASTEPHGFSEADLRFLAAVANVLAEAIARRDAEERLRRSRQELQAVLDHAGVILFALDGEGRLTMAEGQTMKRLGIDRGAILGRPLSAILTSSTQGQRAVRDALRGRFATYELIMGGRDLDVVLHPVIEDGATRGVIGVGIDVSERRLAEVAQQESEAKSRFLAAMSHELRTPLNAVLGFAQLLGMDADQKLDERQARYVRNIEQSGRHLLSLINDVLDLSKVGAGQMPVHLKPVPVADVIESVVAQARSLLDEKQLAVSLPPTDGLVALADGLRLEQVLWNLLSNAVKFTPGGGAIEVGAVRHQAGVELWVRDDGIGIPADQLERIFDEFTQVDPTLTRNHQGTGLGLALSRRLVELMGGRIEVASALGRGSRFSVLLPAASVPFEASGRAADGDGEVEGGPEAGRALDPGAAAV